MRIIDALNQSIGEFPATMLITSVIICAALLLIHVVTTTLHKRLGDVGMHELSLMVTFFVLAYGRSSHSSWEKTSFTSRWAA